ncbi:MAG: pentapeptide repeat-containing protein [Deltaproteobacteria bacterium]|nr:pentapeptide repeat-containing protein [Deltaproteobacteria bacterium]
MANFVIAYAALDGFLGLSLVVGAALASTAAVQAFVPYPILAAALGDRNAGQPVLGRLATPMVMVMVGLTALLAVVGRGAGSVGWLAGPGRAFQRGLSSRTGYAGRDLRGYRFGAANLRGASFRGARLREADLRGAHGRFNSFIEADLSGATLEGASLEWALLESATLIGANLQEARLPNCRAEGADWSGADLRRAVLVGCDLEQSVLISADLRGADLRYATMSLTDAYIRGARWDGALCPDGLVADADTGCVGHEGELDALRDERARYEGFYERVEPVTLGAACTPKTAPPEVSKVVFGNALHFLGTMFVRQTDTRFVGGSFDGHHVLEWSWDEHDTPTVRLTDEHCGEFRWRRVR